MVCAAVRQKQVNVEIGGSETVLLVTYGNAADKDRVPNVNGQIWRVANKTAAICGSGQGRNGANTRAARRLRGFC